MTKRKRQLWDEDLYRELRRQGYSREKATRLTEELLRQREAEQQDGRNENPYESWTRERKASEIRQGDPPAERELELGARKRT